VLVPARPVHLRPAAVRHHRRHHLQSRPPAFEFKAGPLFTHIVLADEINRATPKTQSSLLEAMGEFRVSVDSQTHALPNPFFVVATLNPVEHHGTFPLPDSQLDRFLMRLEMGYPDEAAEREIIVRQRLVNPADALEPVLSAEEVVELQQRVRDVHVDGSLLDFMLALVRETRRHPAVELGVSPRGSLSLFRGAQALALVEGGASFSPRTSPPSPFPSSLTGSCSSPPPPPRAAASPRV